YAMRLVQGENLLAAVERFHATRRRTPVSRGDWPLLGHFIRVCQTIHHAHEIGVLHRDLAPRNVLLTGDGETFVIDWGLASETACSTAHLGNDDRDRDAETREGTAPYTAPEVFDLNERQPFSRRSDIYSLGSLLYLILTGRPPYAGSSTPEVAERVRQGPSPDARVACPGIPRPLARICARAMSRKLGDRYATAHKLARDVEAWVAGDRVSADREPWHEAVWRWTSRYPTRTTVGAFLVLLAFVVLTSASLILAARSQAALKANEAARYHEQALLNNAHAYITYATYADNLVRKRTGDPHPIASGDLVRSLLRVLEQRDQDPKTVSENARAALEILEKSDKKEAETREIALKTVNVKLREGISVFEELTREFPTKRSYRVLLGRYYHLFGTVETTRVTNLAGYEALLASRGVVAPRQRAVLEATLALFDKALATLPPDGDDVHKDWFNSWLGRALALVQLGRFTESLLAWDQAVAFADGPEKTQTLAFRSVILKGAEVEQSHLPWSRPPRVDHAKAMWMAEHLANHEGVSPAAVYNAACAFSLASLDATADAAERRRRADRAMTYLQGIDVNDYFRPRAKGILGILSMKDTLHELLTDPDLDPLRGRPDFKTLATTAAAKTGNPAATSPSATPSRQ
ncbi:MAG TPA: protein kinase, partial [Isosphaeraceae bacterium]|nr:protein kinase [Isosphaeraceae bacterium]